MRITLLILLALLSGCASMSTEYWQDRYANMTPAELEAAKNSDVTVTDIWIGAQTSSKLVCIDGDCVIVQVY
jgi:hypothetical protein